ncbi:MAG: DUF2062 domain-containing protein [Desulfuromonas sp.]|nr:MAG: DUF2062 domain-containing protein [Desulfuromonas sp.]
MPEALRVLAVIPLYNHGATVRAVAEKTLAILPDLLVVDDGSSDDGAKTLVDLPLTLLQHEQNCGKGAALMSAAEYAKQHGFSHILTLDADGQHDPADIPGMLEVLEQDPRAIVVGKRDFDQESIPGSSRFGRGFSNFWLRLQTGKILGDTQSGFRTYPLYVLEGLSIWTRRYNFEIEVLVRAAWAGVPLRDAPISVYYPPGKERISHFRGFMDNWRLTLLNTHLTLRSIVPWPHRKLIHETQDQARVSIFHPVRSLRTLLTENSSPLQLAYAAFVGVFLGALPLLFAHTISILFAAGFLRLNKVAAVGASQLCMPPLVPALCIELGYYLLNGHWLTEFTLETLGYQGLQRLWEWLLGSLLLGPLLGGLTALVVYLVAHSLRREIDATS